jgi:hypothetical protein
MGAVRVTVGFTGRQLSLLSATRIEMVAAPSDPVTGYQGERGFWVEVRDSAGRVLHRRVLADPLEDSVEVFSDDPTASISRMPVRRPQGSFEVLVPDLDQADHLAVMASGPPTGGTRSRPPAAEVARFTLLGDIQAGGT